MGRPTKQQVLERDWLDGIKPAKTIADKLVGIEVTARFVVPPESREEMLCEIDEIIANAQEIGSAVITRHESLE